jgi:hypothetical protein
MIDWDPKDEMSLFSYIRFKLGGWAEVETIPEWVESASDPPPKRQIPTYGSVEAVFTGNNLEYKFVTKRGPPPPGQMAPRMTVVKTEYYARIK